MEWAYGITTVPTRRDSLLVKTVASLAKAGFECPRLFVDGVENNTGYERFDLEITTRSPSIRTFGNWILGLAELYIRNPIADRYAMFQDDFVTYRNLRQYLEQLPYPERGYCNLYTFPRNQALCKSGVGWYLSDQLGKGAVALVFSHEAVMTLLCHEHIVKRPQDSQRGWRAIDGGIVTAFKKAGWKEYVHNPSLVQHTGIFSSMGNAKQAQAMSFRGESFDALTLLGK
ncbi:hypothetical protein M0R72_07405 [Candidatus Pacearchaeota archaeon]|jgi:hypothetical protein|nr:hypothetical protein [Candidatus Pacearchaeota archaeon]